MKTMRKVTLLLLSMCMVLALLTSCGNEEAPEGDKPVVGNTAADDTEASGESSGGLGDESTAATVNSDAVDWDEDPAEVTWMMWNVGGSFTQDGLKAVEDAVNEITLNKINVRVNLEMLEMGSYLSQMPMQVGAGDKIDLISTFPAAAGSFNSMVNSGQLQPLDELLAENAPETLALLPEQVLDATTFNGEVYAVPVYTDNTNNLHWICKEAYLTEAGFTAEDIKSVDDVTKVFEAVYALHPDMKMISGGAKSLIGSAGVFFNGVTYDTLGTELLGVMIDDDPSKVVSIYETEAYENIYTTLRGWYEKGYIDKDVMIREADATSDTTVFSFFLAGNKLRTAGSETMAGEALVSVPLTEGCITTGTMTMLTMAIPVCATEPEAAARLLNLCYTDKDLKMLVSYGIGGENYTYNDDNALIVNTSGNYAPNTVGIFGNVMLCDPPEAQMEMGYNMSDIDQSSLYYSPLLGFSVNTDPISNEAAALSGVYTEYQGLINCGLADEATLKEFIDKLYANGLQVYMDEVQRQLDEWLKSKQ